MTTTSRRPHPPVAITTDRHLLKELRRAERRARARFANLTTIPSAARADRGADFILIGTDQHGRIHEPVARAGRLVIVATTDEHDPHLFTCATNAGAQYAIVLPAARDWLAKQLRHHNELSRPTAS